MDLTKFAEPKSDQLNADDLIGGHIIARIVRVTTDDAAQKVNVHLEGRRPWRPCKTTLRQLFAAWGTDGEKWVGRYVELKRDATVRFGGEDVGGIRIHALSHIPRPMDDKLTIAKGKKGAFRVEVLIPPLQPGTDTEQPAGPMDLTTFKKWCGDALKRGWTRDQVAAIIGADKADAVPENDRREIVARLKGEPPVTPDETPATEAEVAPAADAEPTPTEST